MTSFTLLLCIIPAIFVLTTLLLAIKFGLRMTRGELLLSVLILPLPIVSSIATILILALLPFWIYDKFIRNSKLDDWLSMPVGGDHERE